MIFIQAILFLFSAFIMACGFSLLLMIHFRYAYMASLFILLSLMILKLIIDLTERNQNEHNQ